MKITLEGKTALVTGSSRGIGQAVARTFVENGAKVIVSSEQSIDTALATREEGTQFTERWNAEVLSLRELLSTGNAQYVQADMGRDEDIERLVEKAWELLGTVDILVNNVGIYREPDFLNITREDFDTMFHINAWSHIHTIQEFIRRREAEGRGGRIICTTSINDLRSEPDHTLYDMTKAAVSALVRQLGVQLANRLFTIMGVAPGLHETSITDFGLSSDSESRRIIEEQIPLGIGSVEHLVGFYLLAASDAGYYGSGNILRADGGITAMQMPVRPVLENERQPN